MTKVRSGLLFIFDQIPPLLFSGHAIRVDLAVIAKAATSEWLLAAGFRFKALPASFGEHMNSGDRSALGNNDFEA
jgi:hypothetical protein